MKKLLGITGLAIVVALAVQSTVYGANRSWKGTDTTNNKNMTRDGNWVGVRPVGGDIIQFNSNSTGSGLPNLNDNFVTEMLRQSTQVKNIKMAGNAANTLRLRSTGGKAMQVAGTKDIWLNFNGNLRQDNDIYGTTVNATEVEWETTSSGNLILSTGSITLEADLLLDVQSTGVIDIRTALDGYTATKTWDVRKTGAGTLILGAQNLLTGNTTVEGGTVQLAIDQAINSASDLIFNDGTTLQTGGFSGDFATLEVNGTVVFDLGGLGSSVLNFADSSAVAWGTTLDIINYTAGDSISFGTDGNGLSATQLAGITINGEATTLDASGNLTVIPEPAAIALMIFSGIGIGFFRRLAI
jgi:autotransporter-associated beta strand protein